MGRDHLELFETHFEVTSAATATDSDDDPVAAIRAEGVLLLFYYVGLSSKPWQVQLLAMIDGEIAIFSYRVR